MILLEEERRAVVEEMFKAMFKICSPLYLTDILFVLAELRHKVITNARNDQRIFVDATEDQILRTIIASMCVRPEIVPDSIIASESDT